MMVKKQAGDAADPTAYDHLSKDFVSTQRAIMHFFLFMTTMR